jgi:hypothetical protein
VCYNEFVLLLCPGSLPNQKFILALESLFWEKISDICEITSGSAGKNK